MMMMSDRSGYHACADACENPHKKISVSQAQRENKNLQRNTAGRPTLHLLWCHERCYKADKECDRDVLNEAAHRAGMKSIALKKSTNYARWCENHGSTPHILVTNWREAKPCVLAMQAGPNASWPSVMIVLCETPRDVQRVSRWQAEQRDGPLRVEVVASLMEVLAIIHLMGEPAQSALSLRSVVPRKLDGGFESGEKLGYGSDSASTADYSDVDQSESSDIEDDPSFDFMGMVADMLASHDPHRVERLLLSARPAQYFD